MSQNSTELKDEKKNRRRGAFYSFTLHALILLIAILPFMDPPADIDKNFAIVVEFEKPIVTSGSKKESAKSSSSDESAQQGEDEPRPERTVEEVRKIETQEFKPTTKPIEEVITAPEINVPQFPEPVETPQKIETTSPQTTPTTQSSSEPSIDDFLPVLDKIIEEETASGSGSPGDSDADPNASGQGGDGGDGVGKADNGGSASGSGTGDNSLPPGDFGEGDGLGNVGFDGEGPLTRRVKFRPNCANLAYKDAKIVLDLCINRDGDITYSKYNLRRSSVKDRSYARQITTCFRDMLFEEDGRAPSKECGTYTYKFSFEGHH